MKRFLLSLLIPCSIITAAETPTTQTIVTLDFFKPTYENNRITATGWVDKTESYYFVEKDLTNNTWAIDRMIPTEHEMLGTTGTVYEPVTDEPEILAAFAVRMDAFQKSLSNLQTQKSAAKKSTLKKKDSIRAFFSKKK